MTQIVVKYYRVDGGSDQLVKKLLKSCQKLKSFKGLKIRKDHRFGGTFTKAPMPRQLDTKNLCFRSSSDSFSSSFCWDQEELSQYHFQNYRQSQANRSADALSAPSSYLRSARLSSTTLALGCTLGIPASRQLENSLCTFSFRSNSADALRKKMSQPRISLIVGRMLKELNYYGDLQLLPIPTHRQKGISYDLIFVIVSRQHLIHLGFLNSIVSDWDLVFSFKFWCPRYHFQSWLQIHAFELDCNYRPHVSYEDIK